MLGYQIKSPQTFFSRCQSAPIPPSRTRSQPVLSFVCFELSCMHSVCLQWLKRELLSLTHPSHEFYNTEATPLLPLAFPPHDIFPLSSINQTPRPAWLKTRSKAFEENRLKKNRGFCTERVQEFGEFPDDSCNKSLGQSSLTVHAHRCRG